MDLATAGIGEQPFRTHGRPLAFVSYQGQLAATDFLQSLYRSPHGLGLFQGPSLSGKSTIIHHFASTLHDDAACAIVDGRRRDAKEILAGLLKDFGFETDLDSHSELMNLLRVFVMQKAAACEPPLIVIENTHALHPDALQVLCELALLRVGYRSAVRIVMSSDRPLGSLVDAPAMDCIARRITGTFNLVPMDEEETGEYLHQKLRAGGCDDPASVVPDDICTELHAASGGWPGIVDRLMLLALARAESCPLTAEHIERPVVPPMTGEPGLQLLRPIAGSASGPKLILTHNGKTLREIPLVGSRMMIGRSEHNDIAITSRFISRHHALVVRDGATTLLMDLNSTNGTFVNSQRISNHIMVHDDVINLGHHGLKFYYPAAKGQQPLTDTDFSETAIMKSLDDMRQLLARENTQVIDLPQTGSDND